MAAMRTYLLVLLSLPAAAQTIYKWTDARGTVHYTDDPNSVPNNATLTTTEGAELTNIEAPKSQAPAATVQASASAQAADDRAAEQQWRAEFRQINEKIHRLEDEIAVDKKIVDDPRRLPMTGQYQCAPYFGGGTPFYSGSSSTFSGSASFGFPVGSGSFTLGGHVLSKTPSTFGPALPSYVASGPCWYQPDGEYQRTVNRLERSKLELARAKEELHELEVRAANAAVPFEWRR